MSYWIATHLGSPAVGPNFEGKPTYYDDIAYAWLFDSRASANQRCEELADIGGLGFVPVEVADSVVHAALEDSPLAPIRDTYLAQTEDARRRALELVVRARGLRERIDEVRDIDGPHLASQLVGLII